MRWGKQAKRARAEERAENGYVPLEQPLTRQQRREMLRESPALREEGVSWAAKWRQWAEQYQWGPLREAGHMRYRRVASRSKYDANGRPIGASEQCDPSGSSELQLERADNDEPSNLPGAEQS